MISGRRCTTGSSCCTRTGSSSDSRTGPLRCRRRCRRRRPSDNQLYRKWRNIITKLLNVGLKLLLIHEGHKCKTTKSPHYKKYLVLQLGSIIGKADSVKIPKTFAANIWCSTIKKVSFLANKTRIIRVLANTGQNIHSLG